MMKDNSPDASAPSLLAETGLGLRDRMIGTPATPEDGGRLADWRREFDRYEVDHVWDVAASSEVLDERSRSICILALLFSTGLQKPLAQYIRGVLSNRILTREEIRDLLIQCPGYIGYPRTLAARRITEGVFAELQADHTS